MADEELQRVLGQNVRALREQGGLSQEAFGDAVGLHRTYIGGIERGERNLTLQTVQRLGEVLGVAPVALLIDWEKVALPSNPHLDDDRPATMLRAASDGTDPGPGARSIARRAGKARPPRT